MEIHNWLVVDLPLWNILVGWEYYSQYMESHKINVPNHQPNNSYIYILSGQPSILPIYFSGWPKYNFRHWRISRPKGGRLVPSIYGQFSKDHDGNDDVFWQSMIMVPKRFPIYFQRQHPYSPTIKIRKYILSMYNPRYPATSFADQK